MEKTFLHLKDITKTYDDGFTAVNKFDLKINKGEFVTFLGPSGCGKTTMLKIIAGFENPTNGKILYNGIDIKDMAIKERPTSTVFQDYALFPNMTVKQNVEYGLKLMRTPMDNIEQNIYVQADKVFQAAKKKAIEKINQLKKQRVELLAEIKKLDEKYLKNENINAIKDMRRIQYLATLDELYKKRGIQRNEKDSLISRIKNFFNREKLDLNNPIDKEIFNLKKWYKEKSSIDKKYDYITYKYNDLDYWESYWATYPELKKEQFEKHNITRRLTKAEVEEKALKVLKLVGLENKLNSYPADLSGGMQQRVALARSIVIEPEIILLDEPLSALDAKVRKQLQDEIKNLHKNLGITFILVTHDQEEALSLSDKIVVMSNGQIQQVGSPQDIYDSPSNLWVANFIGKTNIFEGKYLEKGKVVFDDIVSKTDVVDGFDENEECLIMIRPEDFDVLKKDQGSINVKVISKLYRGQLWEIKCQYQDMIIHVEDINEVNVNDEIALDWDDIDVHVIRMSDDYQKVTKEYVISDEI
ncbi:ATP-binding cassette domain-containing protein [Ureaplasma canigenitalium]|uniref:ATP-binding cassette domain-containing protein n=1 Tax=Ureaplasma canigenitalium TaxID=42092 RepID=UPI0004E15C00|nr:ATP-binding cassette domain-containing protein [Ureaplasma canigenitalium]